MNSCQPSPAAKISASNSYQIGGTTLQPKPVFAIVRLGKDSVRAIQYIDAVSGVQSPPHVLEVSCTQVEGKIEPGAYVLLWLGSDNNKGQRTTWKQGLRAIGRLTQRLGGPKFSNRWTLIIEAAVVLPHSVTKRDLLAGAPETYYDFCGMPVLGVDDHSNQTARRVKSEAQCQDITALFCALEMVNPGFKEQVVACYPELSKLFVTLPAPSARTKTWAVVVSDEEAVTNGTSAEVYLPADRFPATLPCEGDTLLLFRTPGLACAEKWAVSKPPTKVMGSVVLSAQLRAVFISPIALEAVLQSPAVARALEQALPQTQRVAPA